VASFRNMLRGGRSSCPGLVENPDEMQQDDHRNRHTCHPENYVADHEGSPSLTGMRRRSPKVKRAGTDVSRW
jgi:hypothetical protein